jgi:primosomal protein N' (replication factor Y)
VFASVALPLPLPEALTYRVPEGMPVAVGCRVLVPLGRRHVSGCVVALLDTAPPELSSAVRDVLEVFDDEPFVPADVISLALWVAEYYMSGPGEAIASAVPPLTWVSSKSALAFTGHASSRASIERLTDLERQVVEVIERQGAASLELLVARTLKAPALGLDALRTRRDDAAAVRRAVRSLERAGVISPEQVRVGRADAARTRLVVELVASGPAASPLLGPAARDVTSKQQAALDALGGAHGAMPLSALIEQGHSAAVLKALERRGLVRRSDVAVERDPFGEGAWHGAADGLPMPAEVVALTDEQGSALDHLSAQARADTFGVCVLHGVTGSGKTEVYLRLAAIVQAMGRSALMLVPEIALTPAVVARFRRAFGARVAVQHSGLSDGERYDQWRRVRRGEISVVVGTRSAAFAPLPALGLVIVDEEHDTSYKQDEAPRYHARDVALVRAQRAGALVVLGSATPSLETYANAVSGKYQLLTLTRRVAERPMAQVRVVDMREVYAEAGPDCVLSPELVAAIRHRLLTGQQAVVLLNRRGFATNIVCRQCGGTVECPNCSVTLTVHRSARVAQCHYCDHTIPLPERCGQCKGPYVEYTGVGTERVEEHVKELFPEARVARVDRDTVRRRGAIGAVLARFARREIDLLVGTQMIAKGHDFPQVTLVGVVSADIGLGLADFRAAERTFQLLTQVAGRAGRGEQVGEAIVQTLHPAHYSIEFARAQDYRGFFDRELAYRRAMRYPPHVALVNVVVRGETARDALRDAATLMRLVGKDETRFSLVGPAPAPLARLRGAHRAQFFVKVLHRVAARRALMRALAQQPELSRRVTVDVDPQSVL